MTPTPVYRIDASNRHNDKNEFRYSTNRFRARGIALAFLADYDIVTVTDDKGYTTTYTVTYGKVEG